ncbi:MAG: hypothetical protein HWD61_08430 [Parachlamydiaceae bacterium]|nr:MAG: hypothetical protein HWD61_08430 [Parachlamydiaceae bacterium]
MELKELERFVSTNVFLDLQEKDDIEKALIKKWIKIILEFRFGTSSSSQDKEEKEIRNLIESLRLSFEDDESKRYTARLNGLVEDENAKINEKISNAYTFSSTEEQLKDFNDLPTGAYTLGFDTWF